MVRTNAPLIERMTLIWHSWFATSNQGVASQQLMLNQIDFFRGNALGSFADLLTGVTKDPAMLIWLNGNQNVKGHPNENYAREMMELFSLGADRGAYTETDVREQARALTGWTGGVNKGVIGNFAFDRQPSRRGTKTIFGQTGNYTWQDSVNLCLNHPLHPSFFVEQAVELLRPDAAGRGHGDGARGDLQEPRVQGAPGRRGDPAAPGSSTRPAHGQVAGRAQRGAAADDAGAADRHVRGGRRSAPAAGQQLFYPPDVGGWDYTRWLDTATWRARWFIAALVQGRRRRRRPRATPPSWSRARSGSGAARRCRRRRRRCSSAFAKAQLKRKAAPADVETALRRLVATSPDLQTA